MHGWCFKRCRLYTLDDEEAKAGLLQLSVKSTEKSSAFQLAGWILVRTVAAQLADWRRRLHDTVKLFFFFSSNSVLKIRVLPILFKCLVLFPSYFILLVRPILVEIRKKNGTHTQGYSVFKVKKNSDFALARNNRYIPLHHFF